MTKKARSSFFLQQVVSRGEGLSENEHVWLCLGQSVVFASAAISRTVINGELVLPRR